MQSRISITGSTSRQPRARPSSSDALYGLLAGLVRKPSPPSLVGRKADRYTRSEALHGQGERAQLTMLRNGDDGSVAILDPEGLVVAWYARAGDRERATSPVLARHVAQFYVPADVAGGLPARHLRSAGVCGHSDREGWRLMASGHRFWGVTEIRALLDADGALAGFVHVIRPAQGSTHGVGSRVPLWRDMGGMQVARRPEYAVAMVA